MKEFPKKIKASNLNCFKEYDTNRQKCYLRKEIYEWMISPSFYQDNERCFDLQLKGYVDEVIQSICEELNELGWKTRLAFNNNSLYIYKEGEDPCRFVGMFQEL